ncbi:PGF-CTERM sorting domain-containing protein [Natrarchaeobius chitinivorans]|uniref:PGF-CTERM sorting domain-containing protein n=1 Tax=Natrarchaeobius chitinivorans TaxID=1679083 RepID=A0A3N6M167_NATCH|nr:PGF-CTERM sorting domain-containing protein [Natrarchaeobius chitinivorans]RQG97063.1 PGF-CTERM sorting domain-containing protein [Natrarchaeobius chitinivorans]
MSLVDNSRAVGTGYSNTTTRVGGLLVAVTVGLLLLAFLVVGLSAVGAAEEGDEPILVENVTYESSDDPLELEVAFNDSIDDADATADVSFYDADEYDGDGNESVPVEEDTIEADAGQTISSTFDWSDYDGLEFGETYTVVVDGDDDAIESVARLDGGLIGGGGGGADSLPGFGLVVAVKALLVAGLLAARRN